ncbi:MAG: VPLPA-CTERM sorting domain-containing protein [Tateyamaria sp.]|uniref:VPLPA-CTERM sorting domain-containing protein n=1 Tax=Tateyamaria sp. TaxID=1929288 RepID=UPI00329430FA
MRSNIKTLIAAFAAVIATTSMTQAGTVSPTETLPANLRLGVTQGSDARLFAEQSNVTVGQGDVEVDYLASSLVFGDVNFGVTDFVTGSGIELGAGTYDSFLIHFDPFNANSTSGSFTFAHSIVAIILSNGSGNTDRFSPLGLLNVSDRTFGGDSTTYESHLGRRAEGKASGRTGDTFVLESANEISFTLTTNKTHIDNIRVITQVAPVPLPAGGLLLIAGLGALAVQRRRKT